MPTGVYPHKTRSMLSRLLSKVNFNGPVPSHRPELGACWVFVGACKTVRGKRQYGEISTKFGERPEATHRVSYRIAHGSIPTGKIVLHHCDNKPCIRPTHLYAGDHSQNLRDAYARGLR